MERCIWSLNAQQAFFDAPGSNALHRLFYPCILLPLQPQGGCRGSRRVCVSGAGIVEVLLCSTSKCITRVLRVFPRPKQMSCFQAMWCTMATCHSGPAIDQLSST